MTLRNQNQGRKHWLKYQLGKEQWASKYPNITPNCSHNLVSNDASVGHLYDNAMGNLACMTRE